MCWDYDDPTDYDPMVDWCDHTDYEVDILTGRAECCCGHVWYQTSEEIRADRRRQQEYDAYTAKLDAEPQPTANRQIRDDEIPF